MAVSGAEDRLKRELVGLFGHMNRVRRELAVLHGEDSGSFVTMADTLEAIVENTEIASNSILESMEAIESLLGELRARGDADIDRICDGVTERVNQVFEACSFQDLTGQRISRVGKSLKFVEERVNALVRMWGRDELSKVLDDIKTESQQPAEPAEVEMHGPQRAGVAISQDEVDKLFSQDDIDKLFG
jgi:chemotaxis protein CheZ